MLARLGLVRDPFLPGPDATLRYLAGPRKAALEASLGHMLDGYGVLVTGPNGSGRQEFAAALRDGLLAEGIPTLCLSASPKTLDSSLIHLLHSLLLPGQVPRDQAEAVENVYSRLLEGFWRGGNALILAFHEPLSPADAEELRLLAGLTFLGRPLVALALVGEDLPPFAALEKISLPPPEKNEMADVLRHRLALAGGAGLLNEEIEGIAFQASSFEEALALAGFALQRSAFDLAAPPPPKADFKPSGDGLFALADLDEVGSLLRAISSRNID